MLLEWPLDHESVSHAALDNGDSVDVCLSQMLSGAQLCCASASISQLWLLVTLVLGGCCLSLLYIGCHCGQHSIFSDINKVRYWPQPVWAPQSFWSFWNLAFEFQNQHKKALAGGLFRLCWKLSGNIHDFLFNFWYWIYSFTDLEYTQNLLT